MARTRIAFISSDAPAAHSAVEALTAKYGQCNPTDADVIVALGGDGYMLEALHTHMNTGVPIFGMHRGTVGFLMNRYEEDDLPARLNNAQDVILHPLRMDAVAADGSKHSALAINEVSMLRQTRQAAKIRVSIDGRVRMNELICDGALVCTPAGSTAYNLSVHGPVLPIDSNILALTPIAPFRPRRWRGAILPHTAMVKFEILESDKRPVSAVADRDEVRDVQEVMVSEDRSVKIKMLFDPEMNLGERIFSEQFAGQDG
ncbi:MAG: NAD kinase [Rhodospirillaceae bacterium]|nr:NAD kinase [Rhodospirillaceae bacterium]